MSESIFRSLRHKHASCGAWQIPFLIDLATSWDDKKMELFQSLANTKHDRRKIVIVGAGVAGCLLGKLLRGVFDVQILEKVSANDHLNFGTGLNIGPNAVKRIEQVDSALAAELHALSLPWETWRMMLCDDQPLFDVKLMDIAGCSGWRISWSDLYSVLRRACEGIVNYDSSNITFDWGDGGDGKASVNWLDNGNSKRTIADIDLVVAADGRYSATRESISGRPATRHLGVSIFRLLVDDTSGGLISDHDQWFNGPNRLLAFRVNPQKVYIAGTFPIDVISKIEAKYSTAEFLRQSYTPKQGQSSATVQWIVDAICQNSDKIHWARMQEQDILLHEPGLPVLYLGDAGHGMIPTLGQGATQAVEDACAAAEILSNGATSDLSITTWTRQFEQLRLPRIKFAAKFSAEASDTMLPGSDVVADTKRKMEPPFQRRLALLYNDIAATADYTSIGGC